MNVWIPFVDLTQSGLFQVAFAWQVFSIVYLATVVDSFIAVLPMFIAHIEGQYAVLSKHVMQIGRSHRDMMGNPEFYDDVERNQTKVVPIPTTSVQSDRETQIQMKKKEMEDNFRFERLYVRQLIKFHQKIYNFELEVSAEIIMNNNNLN